MWVKVFDLAITFGLKWMTARFKSLDGCGLKCKFALAIHTFWWIVPMPHGQSTQATQHWPTLHCTIPQVGQLAAQYCTHMAQVGWGCSVPVLHGLVRAVAYLYHMAKPRAITHGSPYHIYHLPIWVRHLIWSIYVWDPFSMWIQWWCLFCDRDTWFSNYFRNVDMEHIIYIRDSFFSTNSTVMSVLSSDWLLFQECLIQNISYVFGTHFSIIDILTSDSDSVWKLEPRDISYTICWCGFTHSDNGIGQNYQIG